MSAVRSPEASTRWRTISTRSRRSSLRSSSSVRGELQLDVLEMHTRKSRTPDHLALQMRSQMAGIHTVQARMAEVLAEYGAATVKGAMRRMIRDCSAAIGERLRADPGRRVVRALLHGRPRRGRPRGASVRLPLRKRGRPARRLATKALIPQYKRGQQRVRARGVQECSSRSASFSAGTSCSVTPGRWIT